MATESLEQAAAKQAATRTTAATALERRVEGERRTGTGFSSEGREHHRALRLPTRRTTWLLVRPGAVSMTETVSSA